MAYNHILFSFHVKIMVIPCLYQAVQTRQDLKTIPLLSFLNTFKNKSLTRHLQGTWFNASYVQSPTGTHSSRAQYCDMILGMVAFT